MNNEKDITREIIGASFDVMNELGVGFLESVYEKALEIEIVKRGLEVESQKAIKVFYKDQEVGKFFADLLVEDSVLVELKAVQAIVPEHQAQLINYLKATNIQTGLLINFGKAKVEYKRCYNKHME